MPANPIFSSKTIDDVERNVARVQSVVDALAQSPIAKGRVVGPVSFAAATSTVVRHGMGRRPTGWIVAGQNAATTIFETARDETSLTLTSSNVADVTLWVF